MHRLNRDQISVLFHSAATLVEKRRVKLDKLNSDFQSPGSRVSGKIPIESNSLAEEDITGEMEMKQWLKISSEAGP